ncbi:MAG: two-component regulator propeller domain-containing protein [Bacteroidota bacterium]
MNLKKGTIRFFSIRSGLILNERFFFATLLCVFSQIALISQVPALQMKYFSADDGIFSSQIRSVAQDSTGFIWVGSRDGLYRYDGYSFRSYRFGMNDSASVSGNSVITLYTDSGKRLWIGTSNGICRYDPGNDNFIRYTDFDRFAQDYGVQVQKFAEDDKGNIYLAAGRLLFRIDISGRNLQPVLEVKNGDIISFVILGNEVWFGCQKPAGLVRMDLSTGKNLPLGLRGPGSENLNDCSVTGIILQKGKIWLSMLGEGIKMIDPVSGTVKSYPNATRDEAMAVSIAPDRSGSVWSLDFTGLKYLDPQTDRFIGFYPVENDPHSIKGGVHGIFQDKQGNYWIYHSPGGIGVSMNLKGFESFSDNIYSYWHSSGNNITAIAQDARGNLWLGSGHSGISIFEWSKGAVNNLSHDENDPGSLGRGAVLVLYRDSHGAMWTSTYSGGLQYYDDRRGRFHTYNNDPSDPQSIAGNDVRSIAEDPKGNLWLAVHGKGVDMLDRKTGKFTHYNKENNGLSNDWTYKVLFDYRGDLWVGSAWGLNVLTPGDSIFRFYFQQPDSTGTLSSSEVSTLWEDEDRQLWIGTSSSLNRYDRENDRFENIRLPGTGTYICDILSRSDSLLWISTHDGLICYNKRRGSSTVFGSEDGLLCNEFNPRSSYIDSTGAFFFGGIEGVDYFHEEKLRFNHRPPPVIIDRISIFNKKVSLSDPDTIFSGIFNGNKVITLDYNKNYLTIEYKALNFINPEKNRYLYILEGLENKWKDAGTKTEAYFPHLQPGHYTFRVIAANNDGIWNPEGASVEIIIRAPWYGTFWARLTLVFLLVGLVYAYSDYRTKIMRKQQLVLEKTIQEKTYELSEKNRNLDRANQMLLERQDQLEQQSEELKRQQENLVNTNAELQKLNATKDKLFSIIAHDLSNPFNTILGFSNLLESDYLRLSDEERMNFISIINSSSNKVFTLLQHLLMWSRTQTNRIQYNPADLKISDSIAETIRLLSDSLEQKGIGISFEPDADLMVWADPDLVLTTLRNLIGNAVKFTPQKGLIQVTLKKEAGYARITITDNGVGMDEETVSKLLYNDLINPSRGTDGEGGNGLGISLCREFIRINRGKFTIESQPGKGSTFSFTLPMTGDGNGS